MKGWERDKAISDKYLDEIKQILGLHLIGEPPIEEDQERNTDLMVLKLDAVRVACRIREYSHYFIGNRCNEFTIRSSRPSGMKTEFRKIVEGWGDYLFYGFGDESGLRLYHWHLIDLAVFRVYLLNMAMHGIIPSEIPNKDGSSSFRAFDINRFPEALIVAKKQLSDIPPHRRG